MLNLKLSSHKPPRDFDSYTVINLHKPTRLANGEKIKVVQCPRKRYANGEKRVSILRKSDHG